MPRFRLHLLTVLLLATLAFAGLLHSAEVTGNDLTGWVIMNNAGFTVTNGAVHLEKSTGWLRTEKIYTNFVFEAEWRALQTNYNSGFYIRAGLEGTPYPTNAWQVNLKESALGQLLLGKTEVLPSKTPKFPINEWVKFRMEARGKKLSLDVNGARAWEFDQLDIDHGYVGIQAEGRSFDFRNVRVEELDSLREQK